LASAFIVLMQRPWFAAVEAQSGEPRIRTVAELASRIANARTGEERTALINSNRDLVTVELDKALLAEGVRLAKEASQPRALDIFTFASDIASGLDDKLSAADSLQRIGTIHFSRGSYDRALECFQRSLTLSETIANKALIAGALEGVGRVESERGNLMAALDYQQRSLKISNELADKAGIARTLNSMGIVQRKQGNCEQALRYYQDSLKIREELGDKAGVAAALNSIGLVYWQQGNWVQALESLRECLRMEEEIGDKQTIAYALNSIGLIWSRQGDYDRALKYFEQCRRAVEEIGNSAAMAGVLINVGAMYEMQPRYDRALEYYQASLKIEERVGDKQAIAAALIGVGHVHKQEGHPDRALDVYAQALKIEEQIGDKPRAAGTSNQIAVVHNSIGQYSEAAYMAERSAGIARQIGDPELLSNALVTLGKSRRAMGSSETAAEAFGDAIAVVEKMRHELAGSEQDRQRFMESKIEPYYEMSDLLIDQGNATDALVFAERAKARALTEVLQSGKSDVKKAMTEEEKNREQKIKSQLVSLNTQIIKEKLRTEPDQARITDLNAQLETARLQFEAFQSDLYTVHPQLRAQRGEFQPVAPKEWANLLRTSDTAVLEFVVLEDRTLLFALTKKNAPQEIPDLKVYRIEIKRKRLAELAESFRQRLANSGLGYAESARKLYDLLLRPAYADLADKSPVIIVPDGPLWELPFQALERTTGRFFVRDHAVSFAPSLTALYQMSRSKPESAAPAKTSTTLLALGNPKLTDETRSAMAQVMDADLSPLPAASTMVRELGRLYGPARSKVYVEGEATEDRLKAEAGNCQILHIASHGIVNNASPMYSQIVLSRGPGSDDDGILEAWEVMDLNLNADLVVLSACETARGRVGPGEGMIGLSWAFFVAGCPSIVASQWKVEAQATTPLMLEFHRNLLAKMGKAEALRQAELKLLRTRQYAHPFYWAGFVVMGNGN
jgi:CHAT domain-containing protein/tetratricopeptide (TPR) repeat protein